MADPQEQKPKQTSPAKDAAKPDLRKADEDPVGKVYDSRLMKRLGRYLLPYMWQAVVSSLAVTLKSLSDVGGPFLVMVGIDHYFPHASDAAVDAWLRFGGVAHKVSEPRPGARHHATGGDLSRHADLVVSVRVHPNLPDAVDRAEDHVRSAPRYLPPHAAHARGVLRYACGGAAGDAPDLRRGRDQRHVHGRRAGHRRRLLHAVDHGDRDAEHQLVAGAAGLCGAAGDFGCDAHVPQQRARELSARARGHCAHQQLYAGACDRHARGAALQSRRARL